MIYLEGNIWSIHPMAVGAAKEAVTTHRLSEATQRPKPLESVLRVLPVESLPVELNNGTAIVPINGIIVDWLSYSYTSHAVLQQTFRHLAEQQPKNGVVLLIDSPGGMAKGSAETIDALNALQEAGVTVTAQVKGGCYSAAYKIASQCQGGIYVHRMDEVGSIGTKMVMDDYSERFRQMGIEVVPFTNAGATIKTLGEIGLPITPEQRAFVSKHVNEVFADFKRCVIEGRELTEEQFAAVSDGRWWLPEEAQRLGLIDGVRTFEQTLTALQPSLNSLFGKKETMATETETQTESPVETKAPAQTDAPKTETGAPAATAAQTESKTVASTTNETRSLDLQELQKWTATFGAENGTKWFLEQDCSYTQACERHIAAQQKQLEAAQQKSETDGKLLKDISEQLGQLDPLNLEKKEAKEEAGAQSSKKGKSIAEIMAMRNKA